MAVPVIEDAAPELKRAIESQHGGTATLAQSVPVKEAHAGAVVWEGVVHVFIRPSHSLPRLCVVIPN
jgi:hypothetical protein